MECKLLVSDERQVNLVTKLQDATAQYEKKFHVSPNAAYVNVGDYTELVRLYGVAREGVIMDGLSITPYHEVPLNQIWLGNEVKITQHPTFTLVGGEYG